jgi:hypothetical protein
MPGNSPATMAPPVPRLLTGNRLAPTGARFDCVRGFAVSLAFELFGNKRCATFAL